MQMWGRNVDEKVYNALVEQFNATHTNQIELTIIPSADYVAKVAARRAAGDAARPARRGPDLHARLHQPGPVPAHHRPGERLRPQGRPEPGPRRGVDRPPTAQIYGVPFYVDASSLFWNKDLFAKAGLDPEKGPTTWQEVIDDATRDPRSWAATPTASTSRARALAPTPTPTCPRSGRPVATSSTTPTTRRRWSPTRSSRKPSSTTRRCGTRA